MRRLICWIAGGLAVLAAATFFLFQGGGDDEIVIEDPPRPRRRMVKEVKPASHIAAKTNELPESGMVEIYRAGKFVKVKKEPNDGYVYFRDADGNLRRTNNKRIILALQPSVNQAEVDAKILAGPPQRPPRRYANATHRQLAQYVQPGKFTGPPDPISDKEALKACDETIKYYDSDSDEVLDEKKSVEELAKELKEYIKSGGHANDYFNELSRRQELEAEAVAETRATVRRLCLEGKPEDAEAALNAFNKYLGTKGIPPVNMSGSIERARKRGRAVRPAAQ